MNGDEWRNYHRKACVQYIGLTNKWEVRFLCGRPNNPPEVTADSTGGLISDVVGIKSTRIQECGKTLNSTSRSWCWNILKKRYCLTTLKWSIGLSSWTFAATAQHLCSPCRGQKEPHDQCEPWGENRIKKGFPWVGLSNYSNYCFCSWTSHIITYHHIIFEILWTFADQIGHWHSTKKVKKWTSQRTLQVEPEDASNHRSGEGI